MAMEVEPISGTAGSGGWRHHGTGSGGRSDTQLRVHVGLALRLAATVNLEAIRIDWQKDNDTNYG